MTATELEPTAAEWHARLRELGARFPVPVWADVRADWEFARAWLADPARDPGCAGRNVAFFEGRVVGTDTDWVRLSARLADELGVHPERLVVTFVPAE
jgi:hypothetical protein